MDINEASSETGKMFLSYPWGPSCPGYGGGETVHIESSKSIKNGDSCNSVRFSAPNHVGTHFDFPKHFCENGASIDAIEAQDYFFYRVGILWLKAPPLILDKDYIEREIIVQKVEQDIDILLIRTGSASFREQKRYWECGHGIGAGVAEKLRSQFLNLRCLGLDFISVSSWSDRELGRAVHKELLCDRQRPLVIIEDMMLEGLGSKNLTSLIALPLRIEQGDGAPCTVVGTYTVEKKND